MWLIAATVVAAWLAHGAIPVFMGLFVVVWLFGYLVLERLVGWRRHTTRDACRQIDRPAG